MKTLSEEANECIRMIEAIMETQSSGCTSVPVDYLRNIRRTLERVVEEGGIPTLTEYVGDRPADDPVLLRY